MRQIPALLLCAGVASSGFSTDAFGNCRNEGPYPIEQCTRGYFAPPPEGSGAVKAAWWQLGYGNRSIVDPTLGTSSQPRDGDGFISGPLPGIFIGNDSGALSIGPADGTPTGGMDLIDAEPAGAPRGALCFGAGASWALSFVDGCADNPSMLYFNDNYLNPYWLTLPYPYGGPGAYSLWVQQDRPMGFLLTEATEKYFALAFIATASRGGDENDVTPGRYDLAAVINGDPDPVSGAPNVIPWQEVPQPSITASFLDPGDLGSDRILALSWTPIRLVHDGSIRPNSLASALVDEDPVYNLLGPEWPNVTGVGVLDQPVLARYQVRSKSLDAIGECDTVSAWDDLGPPVIHPASMATRTVPPDSCVRLCTVFGRMPSSTFQTDPTEISEYWNYLNASSAMLGDLGYEVCSGIRGIAGPLFGEQPILRSIRSASRGTLIVEFETLSEIGVERFEIVGTTRRGAEKAITEIPCIECTSGTGSIYHVTLSRRALSGIASLAVVAVPGGTRSNAMVLPFRG